MGQSNVSAQIGSEALPFGVCGEHSHADAALRKHWPLRISFDRGRGLPGVSSVFNF